MLAKSKLNSTDISQDEFVLINNVRKEFYDMREKIKNSSDKQNFKLYKKHCYLIVQSVEKIQKVKILNLSKQKNGRIMLLSKCSMCNSKKSKYLKEQKTKGLLSKLVGIEVPIVSDLPILNAFFFKYKNKVRIKKI